MHIRIDIRSLLEPQPTGVSSYTLALVRALVALPTMHTFSLFVSGKVAARFVLPDDVTASNRVQLHRITKPNKIIAAQFFSGAGKTIDAYAGGCDVLFFPNINFARVSPAVPYVLTLHDLSFVRYPWMYSHKQRLWHHLARPRQLATQASAVLTPSVATKDDVVELYGMDSGMVHAIAPGYLRSDTRGEITLPKEIVRPFILVLGTKEYRKNIAAVVRAWSVLRERGDVVQLVIAGQDGYGAREVLATVKQSRFSQECVMLPYSDAATKRALLASALCLCFPSHYEGFGFPVLEAMAAGTPVVASTSSAVPEAAGDAALLVRPSHAEDIVVAVGALLRDERLRMICKERGEKRVGRFTWERTARETMAVLEDVAMVAHV